MINISRGGFRLNLALPLVLISSLFLGSASHAFDLANARRTIEELGISLPDNIIWRRAVAKQIDALSRERCDRKAVIELAKALADEGYRREAAEGLVKFSDRCGGHEDGIRRAINLLLDISDYIRSVELGGKLIEMQPNGDNGYFLRAVAYEKSKQCEKAIADYSSAIELFGNKDQISSVAYESMSRCYEQLGQYCDAMRPIENWVALNSSEHDNDQTRSILRRLNSQGQCAAESKGKKEEVFRRKGIGVVQVKAAINGKNGTFILDTGATFVTIKQSFAEAAGIKLGGDRIRISTANGPVDGLLTKAETVQLRSLEASKVQLVVQLDKFEDFGDGVDGLIGMSFLSRFNLSIDAKSVRIKQRKSW